MNEWKIFWIESGISSSDDDAISWTWATATGAGPNHPVWPFVDMSVCCGAPPTVGCGAPPALGCVVPCVCSTIPLCVISIYSSLFQSWIQEQVRERLSVASVAGLQQTWQRSWFASVVYKFVWWCCFCWTSSVPNQHRMFLLGITFLVQQALSLPTPKIASVKFD